MLQQQLIKAERDRILQQIQSGALPAETAKQLAEELEELDEDGALSRKMKSVPKPSVTPVPSTKPAKSGGGRRWLLLLLFLYESNYVSNLRIFFREKLTSVTLSSTEHNCNPFLFSLHYFTLEKIFCSISDLTVEILNPVDPQIPSSKDISSSTSETVAESPVGTQVSGWRYGAKRILGSFASVCQRLNQLLLKVVAKVFPWNRRARRRLNGGSEDEWCYITVTKSYKWDFIKKLFRANQYLKTWCVFNIKMFLNTISNQHFWRRDRFVSES